jgi:hypothetical protein
MNELKRKKNTIKNAPFFSTKKMHLQTCQIYYYCITS